MNSSFRQFTKNACVLSFLILNSFPLIHAKEQKDFDPSKASFQEILDQYSFIADFRMKEAERSVSNVLFWKYPLKAKSVEFIPDFTLGDGDDMPSTPGDGRGFEHINNGRVLYKQGLYDDARSVWLSGRARFGAEFPYHRRNDYYIAVSFIKLAEQERNKRSNDWQHGDVKIAYANSASFLSWAFVKKKADRDALVEKLMPKGLYTLASIYHRYQRYAAAYAAATDGLEFLLKTGRKDLRPDFHEIVAETLVKNRDYLKAVQEYDTSIRQDPIPDWVARAFARVGDIYYDLNNYELAEYIYAMSSSVDRSISQVSPLTAFLRGDSLFWMGDFEKSIQVLDYGLRSMVLNKVTDKQSELMAPWAALRLADSYLARAFQQKQSQNEENFLSFQKKSILMYDRVTHDYPQSDAAHIAKVRLTCLQLPTAEGKNISHSRQLLSGMKTQGGLPVPAIEVAWACEVGSYTSREKNSDIVKRVKEFADKYPESQFLSDFIEPIKGVNTIYFDAYLKAKDWPQAIAFYEANAKRMTPKLSLDQSLGLFKAYVDSNQSVKAEKFYVSDVKSSDVIDLFRELTFVLEMKEKSVANKWSQINFRLSKKMKALTFPAIRDDSIYVYIQRILANTQANTHFSWLYPLLHSWDENQIKAEALEKNPKPKGTSKRLLCEDLFVILSQWMITDEKLVMLNLDPIMSKSFPELLKQDKKCAMAFLDLESQVYHRQRQVYAKKWLKRLDWPLEAKLVEFIWQASEDLQDGQEAKTIWEFLKEKAKTFPQSKLATLRLMDDKTEVDALWNK